MGKMTMIPEMYPHTINSSHNRIFINLAFALSVIIIGLIASVYLWQKDHLIQANHQVTKSYQVIQAANQSLQDIYLILGPQKDFLVTGKLLYKLDINNQIAKAKQSLALLSELTKNNMTQKNRVDLLNAVFEKRLSVMFELRTMKENDILRTTEGDELLQKSKELSDQIRDSVNQIIDIESVMLYEHNESAIKNEKNINLIFVTGSAISIVFLLFTLVLFNRELKMRLEAEHKGNDIQNELQSIVESASDMIAALDLDMRFLSFNTAYEKEFIQIFGKSITIGTKFDEVTSDLKTENSFLSLWAESLRGSAMTKTLAFDVNGKNHVYEVTSNSIKNSNSQIVGAVQVIRDITERSESQKKLEDAYNKLNTGMLELQKQNEKITLLVEMSDIILACESVTELSEIIAKYCSKILNFAGGTLYIMHASKNYLESTSSWGDSRTKEPTFTHDSCWALRLGKLHQSSTDSSELFCNHIKMNQQDDRIYFCLPLIAQNDIYGLLNLEVDKHSFHNGFSESEKLLIKALAELSALSLANVRLRENLHYHSTRDPLTSLFNRRYLEYFLTKEIKQAESNKHPLSVLMLDLDHFKSINDNYGHDVGDQALKEFSLILLENSRSTDIAARFGGEEFILVLHDMSIDKAKVRAEAIRLATAKILINVGNQNIGPVTVSIGVSGYPDDASTYESLIETADKALYIAKHTGRNKVVLAHETSANKRF